MKSDKKINHAWYKQVAEFEWNFFGTATLKDKITKLRQRRDSRASSKKLGVASGLTSGAFTPPKMEIP